MRTDLDEHIRQLSRDLGADVFVLFNPADGDDWTAEADCDEHAIYLREPPDSPIPYLTALHELGHLAAGCRGRLLDREANAWVWAVNNSAIPISQDGWALILGSLESYEGCVRCKPSELFEDLLVTARFNAVQSR